MHDNISIRISGLSVYYKSTPAVNNLSFEFKPGKLYGICGPNGAGKSTLLNVLAGLIPDFSGDYEIAGYSGRKDRIKIRSLIGYAPEDPELLPYLSGAEYLQMIAEIRNIEISRVDDYLDLMSIGNKRHELMRGYSHGMRQKMSLAAALIAGPKVLLLDEALNGLDPLTLIRVKKYFQECTKSGTTILLASHVLELINEWCEEILVMHQGNCPGRFNPNNAGGQTLQDYFLQIMSAAE